MTTPAIRYGATAPDLNPSNNCRDEISVSETDPKPKALEFFAGVGLVRMALEKAGVNVVFANDISKAKARMYALNFDENEFVLRDIRQVTGAEIPDAHIATASFPCTDLSLAGNRAGLKGRESSLVGEFLRILREMEDRRPEVVLLENVPGFATSNGGRDLLSTLEFLNRLGYWCDILALDARHFVPQSRMRLFIIGTISPPAIPYGINGQSSLRPKWVRNFLATNKQLKMFCLPLPVLRHDSGKTLDDIADKLPPHDCAWWSSDRINQFLEGMSKINASRTEALRGASKVTRRAAYRRTRGGRALWEIRADAISGCLRTTRGGSSRQALVEGGHGELRVRWMSADEYARLQGALDFNWESIPETQAKFALGDAVCVPAVAWLARNYLIPLVKKSPDAQRNFPPVNHEFELWPVGDQGEETLLRKFG